MPVNAYGLQFEDLFQGRNKVNDVRLRIALDERKRRQDLADAAAIFDRQLSKQAAFEQMRLDAGAAQDERRIDAQEAAYDRRLAAAHNADIDRRAEDRAARTQERAVTWQETMDKELFLTARETARQKGIEDRMEAVEETKARLKAAADDKEIDRNTANFVFHEIEEEKIGLQIQRLENLPIADKNRAIYQGLIDAGLNKKEVRKKFDPESTKDNTGLLNSLNLNPKQAGLVQAALDGARTRYRESTELQRFELGQDVISQARERRALITKIDRSRLDKFRPDWLKGKGFNVPGTAAPATTWADARRLNDVTGQVSPPPPPPAAANGDKFQAFDSEQLGAVGQATLGGSAPGVLPPPVPVTSAPPEFAPTPSESGALNPTMGSAGRMASAFGSSVSSGPLPQFLKSVGRMFTGQESAPRMVGGAPLRPIMQQSGQQPAGNINLNDMVAWLGATEPTMIGMNQMVIKAIISNPVNKGKLINWIQKYQQSQGVAQQGQQMFQPMAGPSATEVSNPEYDPLF